jgi:dethiobiotin synthetase
MRSQTLFVAGTDTGVGKTLIAAGLLRAAAARGLRAVGLKPVAAGCYRSGAHWVNEDALALREAATVKLDYADVNPVALERAIAPHIAADRAGVQMSAKDLALHCERIQCSGIDALIIEGAGGWLVPLNDSESLADVCVALGAPVVLVVGMRLGCLSHALLTAAAIRSAGLDLAGWVANCTMPEMAELDANVGTLRARLPGPHLGTVPFSESAGSPDEILRFVAFDSLFQRPP